MSTPKKITIYFCCPLSTTLLSGRAWFYELLCANIGARGEVRYFPAHRRCALAFPTPWGRGTSLGVPRNERSLVFGVLVRMVDEVHISRKKQFFCYNRLYQTPTRPLRDAKHPLIFSVRLRLNCGNFDGLLANLSSRVTKSAHSVLQIFGLMPPTLKTAFVGCLRRRRLKRKKSSNQRLIIKQPIDY